jgi:hypothetical protein
MVSALTTSQRHCRACHRPFAVEDIFTVDELVLNPAESGKLAARYNLVEIAEAYRREAAKSGSYPDRLVRRLLGGGLAEKTVRTTTLVPSIVNCTKCTSRLRPEDVDDLVRLIPFRPG